MLSARSATNPQESLSKLDLLGQDEHGVLRATVVGILLCCQSPQEWLPHAEITATCYRGVDRSSSQLDAQIITGPIHQQVSQALGFVVRNMRVAARKVPARVDLQQYSVQAVFEALVNAVAHRDYSIRSSRIRVSMFSDRLEICSPGSLTNKLTIEIILERQATRNEVLTSALSRIPIPELLNHNDRQFFLVCRQHLHQSRSSTAGTLCIQRRTASHRCRWTRSSFARCRYRGPINPAPIPGNRQARPLDSSNRWRILDLWR